MPDDGGPADLTVGRVAAQLGITVRTLHHWDDIGLVRPSARSSSGYRLYGEADVGRLRRVVVYRELGLDLEAVRALLDDPGTDVVTALRAQRAELEVRIAQLSALGDDLERMIAAHERGVAMSDAEQKAAFGPDWDPRWPAEARARWGATAQWQQYAEQGAFRSADEWGETATASAELDGALADAMAAGIAPGSAEADALVERHRAVFSAWFPVTREMQVLLGRMFEGDPAYRGHYDALRDGLASWLRQSIDASARAHGIDPDRAIWR